LYAVQTIQEAKLEDQLINFKVILMLCSTIVVVLFQIAFAAITSFVLAAYKIRLINKKAQKKNPVPFQRYKRVPKTKSQD
jgi:hypothetical protein